MKVMYDAVNLDAIPTNAQAVAGYVDGLWPTFAEVCARWPHAVHLSIATNADHDAECLDVEKGDAMPSQVPAWVKRQHERGENRPVIYANLSTMPAVMAALRDAGIPRTSVRLWVAWYRDPAVEEIPEGFDACQWRTGAADESACADDFLPTVLTVPTVQHQENLKRAQQAQQGHGPGEPPAGTPHLHITVRVPQVHKKVAAAGGGAGLGVVLAALFHQLFGQHLTPAEAAGLSAVIGTVAGYLKRS